MIQNQNNSSVAKAMLFLIIAIIGFVSYIGTFWILSLMENNTPEVIIPEPNIPPIIGSGAVSSSSNSTIATTTKVPLQMNFIAAQNPFSEIEYNKAPRIIYKGSFKTAKVHINGTVVGNDEVFLMFNFGQETGIINGVRTSKDRVNVQGTRSLGGIYTPASSFSTVVDLLQEELGASSSNIGKCRSGVCAFNFLGDTSTAQVAPILILPVTLNGNFGGAVISESYIDYECESSETNCEIQICAQGQVAYECIFEKYGKEEADQWYERYLNQI